MFTFAFKTLNMKSNFLRFLAVSSSRKFPLSPIVAIFGSSTQHPLIESAKSFYSLQSEIFFPIRPRIWIYVWHLPRLVFLCVYDLRPPSSQQPCPFLRFHVGNKINTTRFYYRQSHAVELRGEQTENTRNKCIVNANAKNKLRSDFVCFHLSQPSPPPQTHRWFLFPFAFAIDDAIFLLLKWISP